MAFNSFQYAIFFAVVYLLYRPLPRRGQNVLLLVASYVFYGWWDWRFLSLLFVSTIVDFNVGRRLGTSDDERTRKWLLRLSIGVNLGLLGFFKYYGFFVDSFAEAISSVGLNANISTLSIILPVGISFYTFQTMSYTIDVYRRQMDPTHDFIAFAVFVAFFPQLVAGPIERAQKLLPQFTANRSPVTGTDIASGAYLIFIGLFKKIVIADAVAPIVRTGFEGAATESWVTLLIGVYAFSLQIYGDFSGYSSIARGSARLLGIDLMVNFNQPYLARNITHFWRTWHISLSTWLRDYLYIPLGGNRGSAWMTQRNLLITMLLGGLWHGASWNFVIWGGLHGLFLAVHRTWRHRTAADPLDAPRLRDIGAVLLTFHLVALGWVFFRAGSFGEAIDVISGVISLRHGPFPFDDAVLLIPAIVVSFGIDIAQRRAHEHEAILRWRPAYQGLVYGAFLVAMIMFSGQEIVPFIYFQF